MTQNQIAYWNLIEKDRHDSLTRKENERTNRENERLKQEAQNEVARANRANEENVRFQNQTGRLNYLELVRSNQSKEMENVRNNNLMHQDRLATISENRRHSMVSEGQGAANVYSTRQNVLNAQKANEIAREGNILQFRTNQKKRTLIPKYYRK